MNISQLEYLKIDSIFEKGLPVYMIGASSPTAKVIMNFVSKHGHKLSGVFDERWQNIAISNNYSNVRELYLHYGLSVLPVPVDLDRLDKGIIIVAEEERYQRKWIDYCEKSQHMIYDGLDVSLYKAYEDCLLDGGCRDLERCRNCRASFRSCPIRREWYSETRKIKREKVIRRLAFKAGYICNLKCKYCCEKLPYFTNEQHKIFDLDNCIHDLKKMSEELEYIDVLSFSGGDVMLNKGFEKLLECAVSIDNIGQIYILTNGTYTPSDKILEVAKNNNDKLWIEINSYSVNDGAEILIQKLEEYGVRYNCREERKWIDFLDTSYQGRSVDQLKDLYDNCKFDVNDGYYHILFEGKLSMRCGVANAMLYYLNLFDKCCEDYIDIRSVKADKFVDALLMLEKREYLDSCNYCPGCNESDKLLAPADAQL